MLRRSCMTRCRRPRSPCRGRGPRPAAPCPRRASSPCSRCSYCSRQGVGRVLPSQRRSCCSRRLSESNTETRLVPTTRVCPRLLTVSNTSRTSSLRRALPRLVAPPRRRLVERTPCAPLRDFDVTALTHPPRTLPWPAGRATRRRAARAAGHVDTRPRAAPRRSRPRSSASASRARPQGAAPRPGSPAHFPILNLMQT